MNRQRFLLKQSVRKLLYQQLAMFVFNREESAAAQAYIASIELPAIIKADGLAAGKGVVVASSRAEAAEACGSYAVRRSLG